MTNNISLQEQSVDYQRVAQAIQYIDQHFKEQPSLDDIAAAVHLSKYHFQRLFKRWAGVTPNQFLGYLTLEYAKDQLLNANTVLDTALDAGLSGPSRLHDLFINFEAMTPGRYKELGSGLDITYGLHPTPFGPALIARTNRGICALRFITSEDGAGPTLQELKKEWPNARFIADDEQTAPLVHHLFSGSSDDQTRPIYLQVKGTNFQVKVWQALLTIPQGQIVTYQDLANNIGSPTAARAVAGAIGRNPVGYLIPCHRVIAKSGKVHGYRWGTTRKKAILAYEAAHYT